MFRHNNKVLQIVAHEVRLSETNIDEIINKSLSGINLDLEEVYQLLSILDKNLIKKIFIGARKVKEKIYGHRVVLFAPLYLTNECVNNCLYCGFSLSNEDIVRKELTLEEALSEAKLLTASGQKRLLLVAGENNSPRQIDKVIETMEGIYSQTDVRRINLNLAPLDKENYSRLKETGLGTYQLFQETYHYQTYKEVHPSGPKADFNWRYEGPFRALEGGIDDIGMGVLFGLYDYKYEVLALLAHIKEMEAKYGVGPHTISVPRLKPARGAVLSKAPYPINDEIFKQIVAVLRLAVPYTGLILSTRESMTLRQELLDLGISQISAGSCTSPGGYSQDLRIGNQFKIEDQRPLEEIIEDLLDRGYLPSFCTACYRKERRGAGFIALAKEGLIKNRCQVNALLTLKEYLIEHPDSSFKERGEKIIREHLRNLDHQDQLMVNKAFSLMDKGAKDLFC